MQAAGTTPRRQTSAGALAAFPPRLRELCRAPEAEQALRWQELCRGLHPSPALRRPKLQETSDSLNRYFDGTALGINYIVDREFGASRKKGGKDVLVAVLHQHFGFLHEQKPGEAMAAAFFQDLCELVMEGEELSRPALCFALRRLRACGLLEEVLASPSELYDFGYDNEHLAGRAMGSAAAASQSAQRRLRPLRKGRLEEYLATGDSEETPARVRWVHAHRPTGPLLMALGQRLGIRTHAMGRLLRLTSAQPQLDQSQGSAHWNFLVFPTVHLDRAARRSLQSYRAWFERQKTAMRSHGHYGGADGLPEKEASRRALRKEELAELVAPRVSVSVIANNLAVLWTGEEGEEKEEVLSTVLSVSGQPGYLGKWHSPAAPVGLLQRLFGQRPAAEPAAATAREAAPEACGEGDEEQPLVEEADSETDEEEEEVLLTDDLVRELRQEEEEAEAEANTTFPETFKQVLGQLRSTNSVLRMGSHGMLAYRLVLQGTMQYMDAITLYKAALSRIRHYLRAENVPNKDRLVAKVTVAKLELNSLLGMIQPFCENVMPGLKVRAEAHKSRDTLEARIIRHYMIDIDCHLEQIVSQIKAQIQVCETLTDEYQRKAADRVNEILNFLTVITFLVMPVQLLTGLYGMNFRHMPELGWDYGYHYFFGLACTFTALAAMVLCCIYRAFTSR